MWSWGCGAGICGASKGRTKGERETPLVRATGPCDSLSPEPQVRCIGPHGQCPVPFMRPAVPCHALGITHVQWKTSMRSAMPLSWNSPRLVAVTSRTAEAEDVHASHASAEHSTWAEGQAIGRQHHGTKDTDKSRASHTLLYAARHN